MTLRQMARINMFRAVVTVFSRFTESVKQVPALARTVETLTRNLAEIENVHKAQKSDTTGVTSGKENLRDELEEQVLLLAGMLNGYADEHKREDVLTLSRIHATDLHNSAQNELLRVCSTLLDKVTETAGELADYGFQPEMLTQANELFVQFKEAVPTVRDVQVGKTVATDRLEELISENQHLLDERADRLIRQFRDSQPEFYNEYQKARIIIDAPVHRKQDSNAEGVTP